MSRRPVRPMTAAAALIAGAMTLPCVYLGIRAAEAADPFGLAMSSRVLSLVWNTLRLAATVGAAAVFLGLGAAWILERTDVRARRFLGV
ncbi:MAG TPA: hypothetical protein VMY88_02055, partial [Acidimicrobiales bacterium]|nr:hypothetical protein [Acidimicrobiales bacterium]